MVRLKKPILVNKDKTKIDCHWQCQYIYPCTYYLDLLSPTYTYCHLPTPIYTYLHLFTPTYTYLHLFTPTYTYLHLPTPNYTYLHLFTPTLKYLHLPGIVLWNNLRFQFGVSLNKTRLLATPKLANCFPWRCRLQCIEPKWHPTPKQEFYISSFDLNCNK